MSKTSSLGPQKRKEFSGITKNADPLLERSKKAKVTHKVLGIKHATKPKASQRQSSIVAEEVKDEVAIAQDDGPVPESITINDSDNNDNDDEKESAEESAESELSAHIIYFVYVYIN
jgi:hypothetical protein